MSSRPTMPQGPTHSSPEHPRITEARQRTQPDLNRPLPAPPLPLPNDYEIPALRKKPLPEPARPPPLGHSRSFSHPFPSFFGGKRQEKKSPQLISNSAGDGAQRVQQNNTNSRSTQRNGSTRITTNKQPMTGKCMTCDSTVRWPQDVKVFRCTTCLTINDLEPTETQPQSASGTTNEVHRRPVPVSTERTRRLIDSCMDEYFHNLLSRNATSRTREVESKNSLLSDEEATDNSEHKQSTVSRLQASPRPPRPRFQDRSPSDSSLSLQPPSQHRLTDQQLGAPPASPGRPPRNNQTTSHAEQGDPFEQDLDAEIFRNIEAYLASCLTGCISLNVSFYSTKPSIPKNERPEQSKHTRQQPSESALTPAAESEAFLSELDAKTLLLGDVVENGSWWTGRVDDHEEVQNNALREKSPERSHGLVSARSPRINWLELAEWYRLIFHAGDDWRRRWMSLRTSLSDTELDRWKVVPLEMINRNVMDSQLHLQRSFLKATENLLKRPRRLLKSPEDCRFLLMLLANPLLSPTTRSNTGRTTGDDTKAHAISGSNVLRSPSRITAAASRRNHSGLGRHSGIIKRILGLIAYLPNEIHLHLVTWISKFSDAHFTSLVDLIGSFVTYRLTRQPNKPVHEEIDPTDGLIPSFTDGGVRHAAQMHAALEGRSNSMHKQKNDGQPRIGVYGEDWQVRAAARVMALFFQSNTGHLARKRDTSISVEQRARSAGLNAKHQAHMHGQMIPISNFYNSMLDHADLVADFEAWEMTKTKFTFCQYPFFLSIWAKIHILEHDAKRQMENKAREAFFDSILSRKAVSQYLVLKVRRDCLVDDSLKSVSEVIGRGGNDVKKGLRIDFAGEEGVDAGGLRKEWFLLLVREIFNPNHGLFVYDDDSQYCYFNPFCFESSEQFFLVGVLLGLAIYNSTILDVAFPPFVFKKMLASAPAATDKLTSTPKITHQYSLEDLAELRPSLARGLRQLLEFDGDVQEVFCRDFIIEMERYGEVVQMPLCSGGASRAVTNANRREFVDMYIHYLLDQSVARQYEPFKRGFFTVCGGNALSLFRPEEIELLVRGSDEPLDVSSLRAVASYDGWPRNTPAQEHPQVVWFWEFFESISPTDQRKMLSFITGSDRIPAMGATNLVIRIQLLLDKAAEEAGTESRRLPIARTCFNLLGLYRYQERITLEQKLWTAVTSSEGFGLK